MSQYKGTICSHLLLVTAPSGIWGQPCSGQGAAHSPPYLHPECSWVALFPGHKGQCWFFLLHASALLLGKGRKAWCYLTPGNREQRRRCAWLGQRGKGAGERLQVWFCVLGRGMLVWVPATMGAVDVGRVLCPHLSSGSEKGPGGFAAEWVASRGFA